MLVAKRKSLIKSIIIKIVIAVLLLAVNIYFGLLVSVKIDERLIYNGIISEYPNLIFDKELSKIAEECAKTCYDEKVEAKDIKILKNEHFVKLYSTNSYVAKYALSSDSNQEFVDNFLDAMHIGKYPETDSCLKKCQYIGVGKYENQVFLLAFYNE
ncbi:MAG: hypothetical protein NC548_62235 [Lachnospiraceae bacterium]|nr:hypothetical protein [Lachnospiraceae bacterium]MCM1230904.1 hypothetical protein [Ruminococcus flavefaciens]